MAVRWVASGSEVGMQVAVSVGLQVAVRWVAMLASGRCALRSGSRGGMQRCAVSPGLQVAVRWVASGSEVGCKW